MRFLIDEALSLKVAVALREAGHDAVHVRDIGLASALDETILAADDNDDRILVSADTDFGAILAMQATTKPSFVLLRPAPPTPVEQANRLIANLPQMAEHLKAGAVAVIEENRIRIRALPITEEHVKE